jgi:hypothetical protein
MNGALPVPFILVYYGAHHKYPSDEYRQLMNLLKGLGHVEHGPLVHPGPIIANTRSYLTNAFSCHGALFSSSSAC